MEFVDERRLRQFAKDNGIKVIEENTSNRVGGEDIWTFLAPKDLEVNEKLCISAFEYLFSCKVEEDTSFNDEMYQDYKKYIYRGYTD